MAIGMEQLANERWVTQREIAERLNMPDYQVENIIRKFGHEKIVELLEAHGYYVWYEPVYKKNQFWEFEE